jgi:hypothetical protein
MAGFVRRRARIPAAVLAVVLTLTWASDALALTWGPTRSITTSRNAVASQSLAIGTGALHALVEEARGGVLAIRYRRSTDGGVTWSASTAISTADATYAYGAAIAARGTMVDATWVESTPTLVRLRYRRSIDGGVTWQAPVSLTTGAVTVAGSTPVTVVDETDVPTADVAGADAPAMSTAARRLADAATRRAARRTADTTAGASPSYPRIARDSTNRLVVTWTDDATGQVWVRRSGDGGTTWSTAALLTTTTNHPYGDAFFDAFPDVAAGTGIFYIAYYATSASLRVKRSTNGGATWTTATTIATNGSGWLPDVAAAGSSAVVGYAVPTSTAQYAAIRRTADKGATWKTVVKLTPTTAAVAFQPVVAYGGSAWRVLYERCLTTSCASSAVYYRGSTTGTTWTAAQKVSTTTRPYATPTGLGYSTRVIAMYDDWAPKVLDSDVYLRAGS